MEINLGLGISNFQNPNNQNILGISICFVSKLGTRTEGVGSP
jgi:hypothetical protein